MRFFTGFERKLRMWRRKYAFIFYAGTRFHCPICNRSFGKFKSAGRNQYKRPNAICPQCNSRERDRLIHRFFLKNIESLKRDSCSVLHIAPEKSLELQLKALASYMYINGDLFRTDVNLQFDIHALPFADESFEIVYCSHVLQAVSDDNHALAEIHRVLKPNGWAMINVPARGKKTQDFSLYSDSNRPADFVRIYGDDFADTLARHGFRYEPIRVADYFDRDEQLRMRVDDKTVGALYLVSKANRVQP